jgi:endoglucanase
VFELANTHPRRLTTVIPYDFYPETEWRDDLELGATELADALARGPLPRGLPHARSAYYYLRKATWWARAYEHQSDAGDTPNLYDVSGLADYELYKAIERAGDPAGLWIHRVGLLGDMRRQLSNAIERADSDPFGTGYGWKSSDTVSHLAGLSVMASEYASLTHDVRYATWSARWLDNILGANPWGSSFIIGDGSTSPRCPQHQVANLMSSPLAGGAVEGPTSRATSGLLDHMRRCPVDGVDRFKRFNGRDAVFKDNVQSYSTDEPAIDLTASSPLAFAWQIGR